FILIAGERSSSVYTHEFLESIVPCLRTKGSIDIDFMKLIPKVCSQHLMIISFCSDINGDYVNIRSFFHAEEKELVGQAMNSAIKEVDQYRGIYQIKPAPYAP